VGIDCVLTFYAENHSGADRPGQLGKPGASSIYPIKSLPLSQVQTHKSHPHFM